MQLASAVPIEDEAVRDGLGVRKREFTVAQEPPFVDAGVRPIRAGLRVRPTRARRAANADDVSAAPMFNLAALERAPAPRLRRPSIFVSARETRGRKNASKSTAEALEGALGATPTGRIASGVQSIVRR